MNPRSALVPAAAGIAAVALVAAPAAQAAKPAPPGPMTVTCRYGSPVYGYVAVGEAFSVPTGTRSVYFAFHKDEASYASPYPGSSNGGTDFDGRNGWTSWGDPVYASAVGDTRVMPTFMVVQALDRKGNVLRQTTSACPTS